MFYMVRSYKFDWLPWHSHPEHDIPLPNVHFPIDHTNAEHGNIYHQDSVFPIEDYTWPSLIIDLHGHHLPSPLQYGQRSNSMFWLGKHFNPFMPVMP